MNAVISWLPLLVIGGVAIAVVVRAALIKSGYLVAIPMNQTDRNKYAIVVFALFAVTAGLGAINSGPGKAAIQMAWGILMATLVRRTGARVRRASS